MIIKTTEQGQKAERAVAALLQEQGLAILGLNWRTKACEIDVVARKSEVVYFVEVKYRGNDSQGSGYDYITSKKLQKMRFAAQIWCQQNDWNDDFRLLAASVSGPACDKIELIEAD